MSLFARRVYYLSAFLLFAVLAPLLLAWTSGYRFTNWRSGFVRTGAIAVYSSPKATVYLNDRLQGNTPIRLTHVIPGSYTIEIRKDGYRTWTHPLRVSPNEAQVIGPVFLYSQQAVVVPIDAKSATSYIVAADQQTVFGVTTMASATTITSLWPADSTINFTLPFVPTSATVSPDRQFFAFQDPAQTIVVNKKTPSMPWSLPPITYLSWDTTSSSVFYGLALGQAQQYDSINRQITELGQATSLATIGDQLWLTANDGATTVITRKSTFGQLAPLTVAILNGQWSLLNNLPPVAVLRNPVTTETIQLSVDPISNQTVTTAFGLVDNMWWTDRGQPPIWVNGSDLMSFDDQRLPVVIDRLARPPTVVRWIEDGHILAVGDDQSFSFRSISSQQGRGVLFEQQFEPFQRVLAIDPDKKNAVIKTSDQLLALEEWHWSPI